MRKPVFQNDSKILGMVQAPFFRTPDRQYMSVLVLAFSLAILYIPAAGRLGLKVLVLPLLACLLGVVTEISGSLLSRKALNYFGISSWLVFPLLVPPGMPIWMSLTGFVFGLIVCQVLFGGFGRHVFHPAVLSQLFLLINFTKQFNSSFLKSFEDPFFGLSTFTSMSFTDKSLLKQLATGVQFPAGDMLMGPNIGMTGEIFPYLVMLAGILYLLFGNVNYRTPLAFLATFCLGSFLGHLAAPDRVLPLIPALLSGGALFYAFFIFSDQWTSSKTQAGRIAAGIVAALLAIAIRSFSSNSEGLMFAAAFNYSFSPLYDQLALSWGRKARNRK